MRVGTRVKKTVDVILLFINTVSLKNSFSYAGMKLIHANTFTKSYFSQGKWIYFIHTGSLLDKIGLLDCHSKGKGFESHIHTITLDT